MKKVNNKNGFTLIELVVVMVISVILMGIAGSIFLSSTGFFSKVTISDQDKLAVDKVAEFVIGQVKYASDVVVSDKQLTKENYSTKPDQENTHNISDIASWHYFYIDKDTGRLFHDRTDVGVFTDAYYAGRRLVLKAKKYEFYRLDLDFSFIGKDNEEAYHTSTSIVLPNVQLQYQNDGIKTMFFHGKEVDSSNVGSDSKGIFLYYKSDAISKDSNIKDKTSGGTVAEQLETCKTDSNTFPYEQNKSYPIGSFVWIEQDGKKIWYRSVPSWENSSSTDPATPGSGDWKQIYVEGSEPKEGSFFEGTSYYQGDIVRYFDSRDNELDFIYFYYKNMYMSGFENFPNARKDIKRWAPVYINAYQSQLDLCAIKQNTSETVNTFLNHSFVYGTPYEKLYNENEKLNLNPNKEGVTFYEYIKGQTGKSIKSALNAEYLTNDMVVKYEGNLYINLYKTELDIEKNPPESTTGNNRYWQKLQTKWDENSAYEKGDIVIYKNNLYQCMEDTVYHGNKPNNNDKKYWQRVYWETDENSKDYQSYVEWENGLNS